MQTYLKSRPVWIQLLLFMGMAFGIVLITSLISTGILAPLLGINALDVLSSSKWGNYPNMLLYLRILLLLNFIFAYLLPVWLFSYFADPNPTKYLGFQKPHSRVYWFLGILSLIVCLPFVDYLGSLNLKMNLGGEIQEWMQTLEKEAGNQTKFLLQKHAASDLIINLILVSLFAGVGEELFFRGILQRLFIKLTRSPWIGIVITSIMFSAFHFQFFGFLPRLVLGILLGAIYWYSGSILTAIVAHFLYDAAIIVVLYINPSLAGDPNASMTNITQFPWMALVSAALTFFVVWQMIKRSKTNYAAVYKDENPSHDEFSF